MTIDEKSCIFAYDRDSDTYWSNYYESYVNESGITIHYYEKDVDKVLMYFDNVEYEGLYVYESLNQNMENCSDIEVWNYATIILNQQGSSEGVFAVYRAEDK